MKNYITPEGQPYQGDRASPLDVECAPRPSLDYIPGPNWQTDPMNPAVMWMIDLARLRARAAVAIDRVAGEAALRYITSRPGQEATYLRKAEQAKAHKVAGYPSDLAPYPMIAIELDAARVTNQTATAQAATDYILATEAIWNIKAADIERARRVGKEKVRAATTEAAVIAARDEAVRMLKAL